MQATKYHYVYKITNNNPSDERKYYIGVRTAEGGKDPIDDINYMSSSEYLKEAIGEYGLENFTKEILSVWDTRELANAEEVRIHWEIDVAANEEYYNKANATDNGFCRYGEVSVIDIRDGLIKSVTKEDFNNCNFYKGVTNGQVTVIDIRDNTIKNVSKEEYKKFEYYKNQNSKKYQIFNKNDELMFECFGDFKKICIENGLPENALRRSSRENTKVYQLAKASQITKLKKEGLYQFEGWYAIRID